MLDVCTACTYVRIYIITYLDCVIVAYTVELVLVGLHSYTEDGSGMPTDHSNWLAISNNYLLIMQFTLLLLPIYTIT